MKETSKTPKLNREEVQSRLKKIIERDPENGPKQVALFAARCGLRVLPWLAKPGGSGFWFKGEARKHLVACWRALMISLCFAAGRKVSYDAANANANANDAADAAAADAAYAAAAAADAAYAAAYAAAAYAAYAYAAYAADAAADADAAVIRYIKTDLSRLGGKDGLALTAPLWPIDSPSAENPLEEQTEAFFKACQTLWLDRIANSYQALLKGGGAAAKVADQEFDVWDDLWDEVQKYPDFPPDAELETKKVEPKTKTETEPEPEDSIETPGSDFVFKPSSSILYETDATEDRLSRGPLVSALASWIGDKTNNSHITLGLFGNWGAGKSTFLNLLRQQLGAAETSSEQSSDSTPETIKPEAIENGELKIIWGEFNAWRYEQCDNIQAGVAQTVVESLKRDLGWGDRFYLALRFAWQQSPWKLLTTGLSIASSIAVSAYLLHSGYNDTTGFEAGLLAGAVSVPVAVIYLVWKQLRQVLSHPLADQFKTYLRLPQFGEHLGTIPIMKKQVERLLALRMTIYSRRIKDEFRGELKGKPKPDQRYVFVVDDLDRCSQEGVVQTLEAIRLVMDIPNVVVILAIDPRIALASLAQKYEGLSEHHGADPLTIARDYLGKVIHAPIVLEEPPKADIKSYLDHLWQTTGEEAHPLQGKDKKEVVKESSKRQPNKVSAKEKTEHDLGEADEKPLPEPSDNANVVQSSTEKAENPKHQTQEQETPEPQISAPQQTTVTGLSDTQKTAFVEWINRFGFTNPRQIKRLNNAYSLLRLRYPNEDQAVSYTNPSSKTGKTPEFPRLVMLLWLEYLHELPAAVRCELLKPLQTPGFDETNWSESLDAEQPSFAEANQEKTELWKAVKKALKGEKLGEVYLQVRCFVLPAVNPVDTAL